MTARATTIPEFRAVVALPPGRLTSGGHRRVFPRCQRSFPPSAVFPAAILRFCCRAAVDRPRAALRLTMFRCSPRVRRRERTARLIRQLLLVAPFSESEQLGSHARPSALTSKPVSPVALLPGQPTARLRWVGRAFQATRVRVSKGGGFDEASGDRARHGAARAPGGVRGGAHTAGGCRAAPVQRHRRLHPARHDQLGQGRPELLVLDALRRQELPAAHHHQLPGPRRRPAQHAADDAGPQRPPGRRRRDHGGLRRLVQLRRRRRPDRGRGPTPGRGPGHLAHLPVAGSLRRHRRGLLRDLPPVQRHPRRPRSASTPS